MKIPSQTVHRILRNGFEHVFDMTESEFHEVFGVPKDVADFEITAFLRELETTPQRCATKTSSDYHCVLADGHEGEHKEFAGRGVSEHGTP